MVSAGLGDFVLLLLVLADQGVAGRAVYGKCPGCRYDFPEQDAITLVGELLEHELRAHAVP